MLQNSDQLTEVDFWDAYWTDCKLPSEINLDLPYERCIVSALKKHLIIERANGTILEIGCAPGRWLAFMTKEFGLNPHGLEYSNTGMNCTKTNLQMLGINNASIIAGDFFSLQPEAKYDVVMSMGFIEHFNDVDQVIDLHLQWLKPGGKLILVIPNFRGIHWLIQFILDRSLLEKHNLNIMNLAYFKKLAKKFTLKSEFLGYLGSFEPCLPIDASTPPNMLRKIVNRLLQITKYLRRAKCIDKFNHPLISSAIMSIYTKT